VLHGLEISGLDLQNALTEVLEIPENTPSAILDKGLTASQIVEHLRSFNFKKFHPEILAEFTENEPLVPEDIPRHLTEQTVRVKGEAWRVHKNDADSFPSNPHAHNYETRVKLHLGSGEMFDHNRKSIGTIGCKKLVRIRSGLNGLVLPPSDCD